MNNRLLRPKASTLVCYLAPGIIIFVLMMILPLILSAYYGLFSWSGSLTMKYIGLKNYEYLLKDTNFWFSFKNNVIITGLCIIGQIGIAFIIACLLMSRVVKLKEFHRTVIFLPVVLSAVVVGFLWQLIYSDSFGLLNWFLKQINLGSLIVPWLDDPKYVLYSVSVPLIWQNIGFYLVIFMSAMQSIPKEIFEVCELDGATGIKKAIHVTLPMLYDTLKVVIMLCIAGNMKVFDHIYIMTKGGPGVSSSVMAQQAYDNTFVMFKLGYGSAMSIAMLIISLTLILLSRKLLGGEKYA